MGANFAHGMCRRRQTSAASAAPFYSNARKCRLGATLRALGRRGLGAQALRSFSSAASSITSTPRSSAFASFEPGLSPATT